MLATLAAQLAFNAHGQPVPEEQVEKPEVRVGDSWTYNDHRAWPKPVSGRYTTTVTFVRPDTILTVNMREGKVGEGDGNWTSEWNPRTQDRGVVYLPYAGWFKFPLKVGATYESKYELAGIRGQKDSGRYALESSSKVAGWEEIVVPAGKFRTLRVEINSKVRRVDRPGEGWTRVVIWWAPEVERWVKSTYEDGVPAPRRNELHELVAFKLVALKPK